MKDVGGHGNHSLLMNHPHVHLVDTDRRLVWQSSQWVVEHHWKEIPNNIVREGGRDEAQTLFLVPVWLHVSIAAAAVVRLRRPLMLLSAADSDVLLLLLRIVVSTPPSLYGN